MLRTNYSILCLSLLVVGCTIKSTAPQPPSRQQELRELSGERLRQVGVAYLEALKKAPPQGLDDLHEHLQNPEVLVSPVDNQPYEIRWNVDPSRLPQGGLASLLAWELATDDMGFRCTLLADCKTIVYMNEALFQRLRARGVR